MGIKSMLKKGKSFVKDMCFIIKVNIQKSEIRKGNGKYFIIRYDSSMQAGWTVWERVVLYGCIYASDHKMVPVVDMKNFSSIYQEDSDFGKVNIWDKYYLQPAGVSLEKAIESGNYVLSDTSQDWFNYVRMRRTKCRDTEYLRKCYQKFIRNNKQTLQIVRNNYNLMLQNAGFPKKARLLGICMRGTDYREFHHMKQPEISSLSILAKEAVKEFNFDGVFIATEDKQLFNAFKNSIPEVKFCYFKAGEFENTKGYIGDVIRQEKTAHEAAIDYLTVLYSLNCCSGLGGGVIVALRLLHSINGKQSMNI